MQFFRKWYGNTSAADLNSVSHYYGIDFLSSKFGRSNFHGAMPDALLCAQIFLNEMEVHLSMRNRQQQQQPKTTPMAIPLKEIKPAVANSSKKIPLISSNAPVNKIEVKPISKPQSKSIVPNTIKRITLIKDENVVPSLVQAKSNVTTPPAALSNKSSTASEKVSNETNPTKTRITNPFDPQDPIFIASKFTVEQKHNFVMFMNHANIEELQRKFKLSKPIATDIDHMKAFISFDQLMEKFNAKPYLGYRLCVELCQNFFKK